jgi:hypothetical protein
VSLVPEPVEGGPVRYESVAVNRDLFRIFKGDTLIGTVRLGLDKSWYPELLGVSSRSKATHALILADKAVTEFVAGQPSGNT